MSIRKKKSEKKYRLPKTLKENSTKRNQLITELGPDPRKGALLIRGKSRFFVGYEFYLSVVKCLFRFYVIDKNVSINK